MPTVKSEVRLKLVSTYYDTPTLALHRERLSFRVRKQGREFVQTVKAENPTQADILERKEWEDQGEIRTSRGDAVAPISEIELELNNGDPRVLFDGAAIARNCANPH
jgi:inorganic triphosphatase YgiF